MDILDGDNGVQTFPVSLDDMVTTSPLPITPAPLPAARNRAATTAMISDPASAHDNYNQMMAESQVGDSTTYKLLDKNVADANKANDMQSMMSILSDPHQPLSVKQGVVASFNQNSLLKDKGVTLQTNLLQQPSVGESPDAENARLSSADAIDEIYQARSTIQGIKNSHIASLKDRGVVGATADFLGSMVPFANSIITSKIANALQPATSEDRTWMDKLGTLLQPGSTMADIRDHLQSLPPQKQVEFARAIKDAVASHTGLIFGNDNQFEQFDKLDALLDQGGFGNFGEFMDNVSPLLDAVGVGQAGRMLNRTLKGGAEVAGAARTAPSGFASSFGADARAEPSMGNAAGTRATPGRGPAPDVSDVDFKESHNGNFVVDEPTLGPANQLPNPVPKLTAPVDRVSEPTPVPKLLKGPTVDDTVNRISINSAVHEVNPASPGEIAVNSNPAVARSMAEGAFKGGDEFSQAMFGVDKDQAITNLIVPQAANEAAAVDTRVADPMKNIRHEQQIDPALVDLVNDTTVDAMTPAEKAAARAQVVNDFGNASGMVLNEPMSSFTSNGNRFRVSGVYEAPGGSFSNAEDAVNQAVFSLRKYGIEPGDVQVLMKQGTEHIPVSLEDVRGVPGDYKIRVNTDFEHNPFDLTEMDKFDVKRNWLDRFRNLTSDTKGSAARHVLDAASMLHEKLTGPAVVARDYAARFEKALLGKAKEFSDGYTKLPAGRKAAIDDYIKEANFNGIAYDQADLLARGFNTDESNIIRKWRGFWDDHYALENLDVVRSLRANGYQKFENANTKLYARPIAKDSTLGRFYDPATDSVRTFQTGELDDLYNKGGTLAKLRRPVDINGVKTEYMISRETPREYLQGLKDTEKALNYRPGYYSVAYKAPKFVREVDAAGKPIRTVAVAGDTKEAQHFADRMTKNTGVQHIVTNDERMYQMGSDAHWDIESSAGRVAQRMRGKLLEDASGVNHLGDTSYVASPVEAAMRSAKSIAGRTTSRNMLETAKARFMQQYEKFLPSNGMGGVRMPNTVKEIGALGNHTSSEVADARTTFEYLQYLQHGYVNSIDDTFKAIFNSVADSVGEKGFTAVEKGVRAVGTVRPTQTLKGGVFKAYIAFNPLRQWIIQTGQLYRTMVYNPVGWLSGAVPKYFAEHSAYLTGLGKRTEFSDFFERGGFAAAIDQHNLVAGSLHAMADQSNMVTRAGRAAINTARKIGFDAGEGANILGHAAAVFDRYKRLGRDLTDKAVREQAYSEIRALSYDMNSAGDMPYNQTNAAAILQFMQMPHKSIAQYTNRRLDRAVRARMFLGDMLLWGTGIEVLATAFGKDMMPDDPNAREVLKDGVVSMMYNHALQSLFEGTHKADFSSLDPRNLDGWTQFSADLMGGGISQAIMNSPSLQMMFSPSGRFHVAAKSIARYFNIIPEYDDKDPTKFTTMLSDVAKITGGWNNGMKAYLMLQTQQRRDQYGKLIDENTTNGDSIAQLFGFGAASQQDVFKMSTEWQKDVKSHKDHALLVYKDIKRVYTDQHAADPNFDANYVTGVTGAVLHVFKDDPESMQIIQKQIEADLRDPTSNLANIILRRSGIDSPANFEDKIKSMPISEEDKQKMRDIYKYSVDSRESLKQFNKENK